LSKIELKKTELKKLTAQITCVAAARMTDSPSLVFPSGITTLRSNPLVFDNRKGNVSADESEMQEESQNS